MTETEKYFAYCVEREAIRIRRERGDPPPWTDDPILREWRFCNVFREDDAHTRLLANTLRHRDQPDLPVWIVFARWLSRPCLTEACARFRGQKFDPDAAMALLNEHSPWSHGAYMLKSGYCRPEKVRAETGTPKGGVVVCDHPEPKKKWVVDLALMARESYGRLTWSDHPDGSRCPFANIQEAFEWAAQFPQHGGLMAYEVATDLEHTPLVHTAPYPFAHCGPGAQKGWSLLAAEHPESRTAMDGVLCLTQLANSAAGLWPHPDRPWWPREAEHNLCEFYKYRNIELGGRGKRRYADHTGRRQNVQESGGGGLF